MEIAQKVLSARKGKGLTQEILAEKANLSLSTIKRIEKGKVAPRVHTLNILSDVLEINLLSDRTNQLKQEDNLLLMLTSLIFLFLPPLNILYLLTLKSQRKKKFFFETIGNSLLVFQMSSLLLFLLVLFAVISITFSITGHKIYGQINSPFILYMSFVLINILAAIYLKKRAKKGNDTTMTPQ